MCIISGKTTAAVISESQSHQLHKQCGQAHANKGFSLPGAAHYQAWAIYLGAGVGHKVAERSSFSVIKPYAAQLYVTYACTC